MLTQEQRENWLPAVDSIARRFGFYAAYSLTQEEYVTTVSETPLVEAATAERVGRMLEDLGYEYNGLSALKYASEHRNYSDDGSYRKVTDEHPPAAEGTLIGAFEPEECQYHVHIFDDGSGRVGVYSHYETRPDLAGPWPDPYRLHEHYRPAYGETYLKGVTCPEFDEVMP